MPRLALLSLVILACVASVACRPLDPKITALCKANDNNVFVFRSERNRVVLAADEQLSVQEDAEWRRRLNLPSRSPAPSMINHPIAAIARFGNGWLVGTNGGEWDGALHYVPDGQQAREVKFGNVDAIRVEGRKAYVFGGILHMGIDEGEYVEVSLDSTGLCCQLGADRRMLGAPAIVARHGNQLFIAGGPRSGHRWTWASVFESGKLREAAVSSACN